MQWDDLIKLSDSTYLAPVVDILNKDGALRVCIELLQVNLDIFNDAYQMHKIKDQLNAI